MKKTAILLALTALLVAVFATAALSAGRQCRSYPCTGNNNPNHLIEWRGNGTPDYIKGYGGRDDIDAGRYTRDRDRIYGNSGNDTLIVLDGDTRDRAVGGSSRRDICVVDARSEAGSGCNSIQFGG